MDAIKEEKELTLNTQTNLLEVLNIDDDVTNLIVSYDASWTKRGRQHNSYSGHASLIVYHSKKVLAYASRDIYCKQCKINYKKSHDCRKNHTGSSKSMEADMAVEVVLKNKDLVENKCKNKIIIGDDDPSSIAALRWLSPYSIKKWSDFNHVTKTFNSKLYDIKLNATLREYFCKVIALAVEKNIGNEENVKSALQNIIPHAFGEHDYATPSVKQKKRKRILTCTNILRMGNVYQI